MTRNTFRAIATMVVLLAGLSPAYAQTSAPGKHWKVTVYPIYVWVPVFGADVKLPEIPNPPPCDGCGNGGSLIPGGHVSSSVNVGAFFGAHVEMKRLTADVDWLSAGLSAETARPLLKVSVGTIFGGARAGFKLTKDLAVEAGARRFALDVKAKALIFNEVQWKPGIWEPTVGGTYAPQLTPKLRLFAHADYGGIGSDHHHTSTGTARVEWQPAKHFALTFGYGFLHLDAEGTILSKTIHLTQTLHGPIVGIGIPF